MYVCNIIYLLKLIQHFSYQPEFRPLEKFHGSLEDCRLLFLRSAKLKSHRTACTYRTEILNLLLPASHEYFFKHCSPVVTKTNLPVFTRSIFLQSCTFQYRPTLIFSTSCFRDLSCDRTDRQISSAIWVTQFYKHCHKICREYSEKETEDVGIYSFSRGISFESQRITGYTDVGVLWISQWWAST
jgi:hypothetical protein